MGYKLLACAKNPWGLKLLLLLYALGILVALPISAQAQSGAPPAFPSASAVRYFAENSAPFRPVGPPIIANDPDPSDSPTYSLSGRDADVFHIVRTSGQLEAARPLDYESRSSYSVTVRATDSAGLYDTIPVSIEVTNVDEIGEIVLSQEASNDGPVLNAVLTDPDGSVSHVSWQWSVSTDKTAWKDIPGAHASSYSPSPEDLSLFLRVQARYTDGHGPAKAAETLFNTDLWSSVTNNPPEFPFSESGVRTVSANAPAGQPIGRPVLAGDLDRDLLSYWLSGEASEFFVIGHHTGQLKTRSALNPLLEGRYFGVIYVLDGKGGSASLAVRIDVGDPPAPAALPSDPASPALAAAEPAPDPAARQDAAVSPDPQTAAASLQPVSPQGQPAVPAPAASDSPGGPAPLRAQFGRAASSSIPAPLAAGATASASVPIPAPEAGPAPLASEEGTPTGAVGPPGGQASPAGPEAVNSESTGPGSLLAWLASAFVALVLLAAVLVWWTRRQRAKETGVSLPPPTIGPERRIGTLPVLPSHPARNPHPDTGSA